MEDLKLHSDDGKIFRIELDRGDILVITIPPRDFMNPDKVRIFSQYLSDKLKKHGIENPILVLPNDMELFTIGVKSISDMEEIGPDPFEDVDFKME